MIKEKKITVTAKDIKSWKKGSSFEDKLTEKLNKDLVLVQRETEEESDNFWEGQRQYILDLLRWLKVGDEDE